jgi:hypothetical protein
MNSSTRRITNIIEGEGEGELKKRNVRRRGQKKEAKNVILEAQPGTSIMSIDHDTSVNNFIWKILTPHDC